MSRFSFSPPKQLCGLHCYLYLEQIICDKNLPNYTIYYMTCTQLPNVSVVSVQSIWRRGCPTLSCDTVEPSLLFFTGCPAVKRTFFFPPVFTAISRWWMLRLCTQVVKTCFHRCQYLNFIRNLAVVKQRSQLRSKNINKDSLLPAAKPKALPPAESPRAERRGSAQHRQRCVYPAVTLPLAAAISHQ